PVSRRDQALTLLWSAKESALKALRCGLRLDTRSVNVAPAGFMETCAEKWRPVSVTHIGGKVYCGWWRESNGRVYTVAAAPRPLRLAALQPRTRKLEDCPEVSLRCETVWCAY